MTPRSLLASPLLWLGSATMAVAMAFGCSSGSSGSPGTTGSDASTGSDGSSAADASDAGSTPDTGGPSDSGHGAPAPDALYGCATMGGFGWACTLTASGPDPTDCTDPNFPDCFVGGQGGWCTKMCTGAADCTAIEDAGCTPASCNMRGYCK